jgi:very-short-patch-repair endonuclease
MRGQGDQLFPERRVMRLATRQHGVVARAQLTRLGISEDQVQRRLQRGTLVRVHRGVYAVGHLALRREGGWMAAVLAGGGGTVLSHRSAAVLWTLLASASSLVEVTVPTRSGRRSRRGLVVHRSAIDPVDVTRRRGIPVTRPIRTLIDLAEVLDRRSLERALDEAERLRLCSASRLRAAIVRHRGRRGAAVLATLLDEHEAGATATESQLEEAFLALCVEHGIPRPQVNARLGRYRPDFLWPAARLIVETDGRRTHGTARAFERDRRRDVELGADGYRVLRFTWRQITRDPGWVVRTVREALRRAAAPAASARGDR